MNCRTQFTFYKSFDDVIEDMNDKQVATYTRTLLDVQFLRKRIEDVKFDDPMLNIVWKSQKHSVETSIKGYLDSQKREKCKDPYLGCYDESFTPYGHPYEGVRQQEEGKGKEEEKEKEEVQDKVQEVTISQLEAVEVANYLADKIISEKPDAKIKPESWVKDIEKAIRIDGRTKDGLIACIDWIYHGGGDFWIPNVMSGFKLRDKYDKMDMQARSRKQQKTDPMMERVARLAAEGRI